MALRTCVQDGLWSSSATWDTGVPVDGDTFSIPAGRTVTFDVDQSGFANGVSGTISGTLRFITDGTVTYLKCNGKIAGNGSIYVGNSLADPIPAPTGSTPEVATIYFNGAYQFSGQPTVYCYGEERAPYHAIASKISDTQIILAGTGTLTWLRAGDVIAISDSTKIGSNGEETFTVNSYDPATRTITLEATTPLTRDVNQNGATDYVALVSRNILFDCDAVANPAYVYRVQSGCIIRGVRHTKRAFGFIEVLNSTSFAYCTSHTSTFTRGVSATSSLDNCVAMGGGTPEGAFARAYGANAFIVSNSIAMHVTGGVFGHRATIRDSIFLNAVCLFNGADGAAIGCYVANSSGLARGGNRGLGDLYVQDCTCVHNSYLLTGSSYSTAARVRLSNVTDSATSGTSMSGRISDVKLYNCLLDRPTEASVSVVDARIYHESLNHDQQTGAFRAWCYGGVVNSVSSPVPDGFSLAYQHVCQSASYPVFRQIALNIPANAKITVSVYMRKNADMSSWLPRMQIIDRYADPLVDDGNDALAEQLMTNSTDTWETYELTWENSGNTARDVYLRAIAMSATGEFYEVFTWEVIDMTLAEDIAALVTDVATIQADVAEIQTDVATIQTDVATIQTDVATIQTDVADAETDIAAIRVKTDALGSASVTVTSPVASSTSISLVKSDDYDADESRQISFADSGGTWPDLTGATIKLYISTLLPTGKTGTLYEAGTSAQRVEFELTADEVDTAGVYGFAVVATMPTSGHILTLARGTVTVSNRAPNV